MARRPFIPAELKSRAFHFSEASRLGVSKHRLRGPIWVRLGGGLYAFREIAESPMVRLSAAMQRLPKEAAFSGRTASWLHGIEHTLCSSIEVTLASTSRFAGLSIRRAKLAADEVVIRRGLRTTSALRTVADLGCRLPLVEVVVVLDRVLHMRLVRMEQVEHWAEVHRGSRGVARLRRAIELAEPRSESPMETRLRLLLILAGLPRPGVQVSLGNEASFLGRVDLYYPDHRLIIEFDGGTHRNTLAADNRRQNRLIEAGYRLLRFTASDVFGDPTSVVAIVRRAVGASESAMPRSGVAPSG